MRTAPVEGEDRAARIELPLRESEIRVGQDNAEQKQRIRFIDQPGYFCVARRAHVRAGKYVGRFFQQPATHEGRDNGNTELASKFRDAVLDAETAHFDIDHDCWRTRSGQLVENFVGAFL
jgi:hypothetical protein